MYSTYQSALITTAVRYSSRGYQVGFTLGKTLVGKVFTDPFFYMDRKTKIVPPDKWDGISIVLSGIVCVDFDTEFFDLGWGRDLPPTWKEKSPRGYHLFYRLPSNISFDLESKIKWKSNVDLLVFGANSKIKEIRTKYKITEKDGENDDISPIFENHVLCAPTFGYKHLYPKEVPARYDLTMAPNWIIEETKI